MRGWPRAALSLGGAILAAGVVGEVSRSDLRAAPTILVNVTSSEPLGLYLRTAQALAPGRLVAFTPPAVAARVGDGRLARFHSFLKQVAAAEGARVCSAGVEVRINGAEVAAVAARDREGRRLPRWRGCRRLGAGEVFVLSNRVPNSFDSRYFGPIQASAILGVYRPLWIRR